MLARDESNETPATYQDTPAKRRTEQLPLFNVLISTPFTRENEDS